MAPDERRCPVLDMSARTPHQQNARLRSAGPAVRVELPNGVIAWSVTRGSVIRALTGDPRISRDPRKHWPALASVPEGWPLGPIAFQENFFNLYGDEHRTARRRMAPSFSPRRVSALRPGIEATTAALVGAFRDLGPGEAVDVRRALALPLTMTVICDLFGVPADLRPRIGTAMDALLTTTATTGQMTLWRERIDAVLAELLDLKRREPGPDLASDVAALGTGGDTGRTEQESRDTLFLMLGAGYETAVNLITSAVQELLTHPGHLALVRAGTLGWEDVVEETLRHESPVMHVPLRYPLEDIDLGEDVVIRRGEPILLGFGAAGRDPEVHPRHPDDFDPTRPDKDHLAFGHGPHFCLGAPLARLEAEVALAGLFTACPDAVLDPSRTAPARLESVIVNGPCELWIVPTPW
ncbi:cytochrome P450 [Kitasatospora xanthocidica]|uniref:cytochrome P450 family protein n=1 Tax=Kitasatospora xanthocidica TaxID=83382 RepID=UPI0016794BB2|nr:cytochrome P450 [Kitasatospora xanthocidica]GHF81891.1 cytochrome P450 [Kitasatospora xanthocidica]